MQRLHQRLAPRQHRALVEVSLVGNLPCIDIRRLFQPQRTRRKRGTAFAFGLLDVLPSAMAARTSACASTWFSGASANAGQETALSESNREDQGRGPGSALPERALPGLTPAPRRLPIAHCRLDRRPTAESSVAATQSARARYFRSHR